MGRCCEWCGRKLVARNQNRVVKRYCGRACKAAFQTAAVKYVRFLLEAGKITVDDLNATQCDGIRSHGGAGRKIAALAEK